MIAPIILIGVASLAIIVSEVFHKEVESAKEVVVESLEDSKSGMSDSKDALYDYDSKGGLLLIGKPPNPLDVPLYFDVPPIHVINPHSVTEVDPR